MNLIWRSGAIGSTTQPVRTTPRPLEYGIPWLMLHVFGSYHASEIYREYPHSGVVRRLGLRLL